MKGDERRHERQPGVAAQRDRVHEILLACAPSRASRGRVVDRLDGARDECAARVHEAAEQIAMTQQMLDLDRHVVGDIGVRRMKRLDHAHRVRRAVEEIGIAERDVLGAGRDLRVDVGEHDVRRHDAELAAVDRHHRTMPAQMLAPAARFGGADGFRAAVADMKRRVLRSGGRPLRSGTRK